MAIVEIHIKNNTIEKVSGENTIVYIHDHDSKITTTMLFKKPLFRIFMISVGFSTYQGENIHVMLGFTKLELFTSFTIKNRWLR